MNGDDGQTTGDARVDAALARFDELAGAPLTTHPEIFHDVHRRLQEALTGIEEAPPDGAVTGGTGDRTVSTGEAHRPPDLRYGAEEAAQPSGVGQDPPLDGEDASIGDDPSDAEGDGGG